MTVREGFGCVALLMFRSFLCNDQRTEPNFQYARDKPAAVRPHRPRHRACFDYRSLSPYLVRTIITPGIRTSATRSPHSTTRAASSSVKPRGRPSLQGRDSRRNALPLSGPQWLHPDPHGIAPGHVAGGRDGPGGPGANSATPNPLGRTDELGKAHAGLNEGN